VGTGSSSKELVEELVSRSVRCRRSTRPRGTVTTSARAAFAEGSLTTIVAQLKREAPKDILRAVAEWGGPASAHEIGARLDAGTWPPALRPEAIHALELLGGVDAIRSLSRVAATGTDVDRGAALDAIEALASAGSPEVDEGGMMADAEASRDFWSSHREALKLDPVGAAAACLEELMESNPETAPRVRAVLWNLLTAAEAHFRQVLDGGPVTSELPLLGWEAAAMTHGEPERST
jgi:hypothetical protein